MNDISYMVMVAAAAIFGWIVTQLILRMARGLGTDLGKLIKSAERRAHIGSSN